VICDLFPCVYKIALDTWQVTVYNGPMYVDIVPNRKSKPAVLLREGWREGNRTRKRTLANISHWPQERIEALRLLLKGKQMVPKQEVYDVVRSLPHGHVEAVLGTIRKLGLDSLIASRHSRQRDLVVAMVAELVVHPCSKLATTHLWHTTTLAEELGVQDAEVDELYEAMDWLLERKKRIENKLARRHLGHGSVVLYDISSGTYYGRTCPLAVYGNNRDGTDLPCIVYGLLADESGRPVAVEVYMGDTADPMMIPDQVNKLRRRFGLTRVVLVGERGMLTQTQIDTLGKYPGLGWISALRSDGIRKLVEGGMLQLSLFDERNLAEISSEDYPGERLMACYNPLLAEERRRTRQELLEQSEKRLRKIAAEVVRRTQKSLMADEIGIKVGKVLNQYKMGKHFNLTIEDNRLEWERNQMSIERESQLDGIYVIRTSEKTETLSAQHAVRNYKKLTEVEQTFRCLKSIDIRVRPIRRRASDHVRAHVFLCTLAYYVQWHMRKALAPLLFQDEELDGARPTHDPVAKVEISDPVKSKKSTRLTEDRLPIQSFSDLLTQLGTRTRNICRVDADHCSLTFIQHTEPTPLQGRAFELLDLKRQECSQ